MYGTRLVRGDIKTGSFPKLAADEINYGDVLWYDASNNAVRPASAATGADLDAKRVVVAAGFVGVSLCYRAAGDIGPVSVATDGIFVFTCPSGSEYEVNAMVRADDDGDATMLNQTVEVNATATHAIGKVVEVKASAATTVFVRIVSRLGRIA